jgi:ubiquinone/menaquinone biosynthesis C-methylase UbiE
LPHRFRLFLIRESPLESPFAPAGITAIDPLAEDYAEILQRHGYTPRTPTIYGDAEKLSAQFPEGSFDLVFSRNALDHVENPANAMREMLKVCRPGGYVFLEGWINEGVRHKYHQLHKWNFLPCDGDLIVWNPDSAWSLAKFVGRQGSVRALRKSFWYNVEIARTAA